ncbi:MAG: maltose alpha-D-glucosyltransferase [Acidobacteria bacterium]|nr:MAG: maltose alpha-D-glucosyltransferase [Acidobacteriota bacterium]
MTDSHWCKDAIIYELHVRAFYDSNGDGIGDFAGLTQKLDYLQDLGITAIWLLPFYPSPLRDDGYDIAEYKDVHQSYGTLRDFKQFLKEAHARGLRVITELVVNHTSDQHPWFQRARRAKPGTSYRDFYVWTNDPTRFSETRIIFKDFESSNWTWDPVAGAYYWHRFYSHQPDLNYDNPAVHKAVFNTLDFWLDMGVDGMRLDAIPYLYEREGTNCENLPETHAFLKKLRAHMDAKYGDRMLLGEANQWPEDSAAYFGNGDECHMAFHFPLMPRLFMAIRTEDRFPIIDILDQTPAIPDSAQWALFLRNHDELTLEMVTDEERDYMYRVYASDPQARINLGIRRRLAPLLGNHRRKIELMKGLLFSLPGTPVLYYGDEIGMGDNIYLGDRNGVRTPMQWGPDRNAGFSRTNPQRLYLPVIIDPEYHHESINVEAQQSNPHSLLWWTKRMIGFRKRSKAFGRGSIQFLYPVNPKVLAFVRQYENETVLVLANLSRFVQCAQLDLSAFEGKNLVEVLSQNVFPPVVDHPYFFTLGPHDFFWFSVRHVRDEIGLTSRTQIPILPEARSWKEVLEGRQRSSLESVLPEYLGTRRWFGGKARKIRAARIDDVVTFPYNDSQAYLCFILVEYIQGDAETYLLPLNFAEGERAREITRTNPQIVLARFPGRQPGDGETVVYDPLFEPQFATALLSFMHAKRSIRGNAGGLEGWTSRQAKRLAESANGLEPYAVGAEQSNTSIVYGDEFILKVFRRLEPGINPDLELGRFLTDRGFEHVPQVAGAIEYVRHGGQSTSLGILQTYVPNQGDAWEYTLEVLKRYFERVLAKSAQEREKMAGPDGHLFSLLHGEIPREKQEIVGTYLESARILGQRTGEMHVALASEKEDPEFAPEPYTTLSQRSLFQSLRSLSTQVLDLLRSRLSYLPESIRGEAQALAQDAERIVDTFKSLLEQKINAARIRIHGDYHLGQVLYTGKDFVIIDFEGEPARPLGERRLKRSPLRDVAGMLRSFDYAVHNALRVQQANGLIRSEDVALLEPLAELWNTWVSVAFLKSYLDVASQGGFLPDNADDLELLLKVFVLEKAIYELGYELNNRPDWVSIPLRGIRELIGR